MIVLKYGENILKIKVKKRKKMEYNSLLGKENAKSGLQ